MAAVIPNTRVPSTLETLTCYCDATMLLRRVFCFCLFHIPKTNDVYKIKDKHNRLGATLPIVLGITAFYLFVTTFQRKVETRTQLLGLRGNVVR